MSQTPSSFYNEEITHFCIHVAIIFIVGNVSYGDCHSYPNLQLDGFQKSSVLFLASLELPLSSLFPFSNSIVTVSLYLIEDSSLNFVQPIVDKESLFTTLSFS